MIAALGFWVSIFEEYDDDGLPMSCPGDVQFATEAEARAAGDGFALYVPGDGEKIPLVDEPDWDFIPF